MSKDCTIHLFSLKPNLHQGPGEVIAQIAKQDTVEILISGIPHGWIHKPHHQDAARLLSHDWHLFLLTETSSGEAAAYTPSWPLPADAVTAHITAQIAIPQDQFTNLKSDVARERARDLRRDSDSDSSSELRSSPQLPGDWTERETGFGRIPERFFTTVNPGYQTTGTSEEAPAGTLRLDLQMASFLSTALPGTEQQGPVSLFNLFKYADHGDASIHNRYMGDFKRLFGDSAGARVKFMGRLGSQFGGEGGRSSDDNGWQDANLTHYDSIYHYAYMLSTDTYQRLNKDKVRGLEDTGILLVSEGEAWHEKRFGSQTPLG